MDGHYWSTIFQALFAVLTTTGVVLLYCISKSMRRRFDQVIKPKAKE